MSYQPQLPPAAYHMGNMAPYVAGGPAPGTSPYSQGNDAMHYGTPVDANNPYGYVPDGHWSNGNNNPNNNANGHVPHVYDPNNPNNAHDYRPSGYGSNSHNNPNSYEHNSHSPNSHNNANDGQNDSGATTPVKNPDPAPPAPNNNPNQPSTVATVGVVAGTAVTTGFFTGFGTWCFNTFGSIMDCCGGCTKCFQD